MTKDALVAENITCIRQNRILFKNLSLHVRSSQLLLVMGENGSGKSSLLRLLAGIAKPFTGHITRTTIDEDDASYSCHYLGHDNGHKMQLTVKENLSLFAKIHATNSVFLEPTLEYYHLIHLSNRQIMYLSQGQKRRVALARLHLITKKLWILDEPLSGLDTKMQEKFFTHLKDHLADKGMAVISTHQEIPPSTTSNMQTIRLEHAENLPLL